MKTLLPLIAILMASIGLTACNPNDEIVGYTELATMMPATYTAVWSGDVDFDDETYGIVADGHLILWVTVDNGAIDTNNSALYVNGTFEVDGVKKNNGGIGVEGASAYNDASGNVHLKSTFYGAQPPPNGPPPINCVTQPLSDTLVCHWGNGEATLKLVSDNGSGLEVSY